MGVKTTGEEGDRQRQVSAGSPSEEHVEQVAAVLMLYIQCQTVRDCLREREWERARGAVEEAVMVQGQELRHLN